MRLGQTPEQSWITSRGLGLTQCIIKGNLNNSLWTWLNQLVENFRLTNATKKSLQKKATISLTISIEPKRILSQNREIIPPVDWINTTSLKYIAAKQVTIVCHTPNSKGMHLHSCLTPHLHSLSAVLRHRITAATGMTLHSLFSSIRQDYSFHYLQQKKCTHKL